MLDKDFVEYKQKYPKMTFKEVQEWHSRLWKDYPEQNYYNHATLHLFFADVVADIAKIDVVELGGWRGEAAEDILGRHGHIRSWTNYEICKEAADSAVCKDKRYSAPIMKCHLFDGRAKDISANVFVSSHSMEHLIVGQVDQLLEKIKAVQWLYVDTPLLRGPRTAFGTDFHVYELGWDHLASQINGAGFSERGRRDNARWYRRV